MLQLKALGRSGPHSVRVRRLSLARRCSAALPLYPLSARWYGDARGREREGPLARLDQAPTTGNLAASQAVPLAEGLRERLGRSAAFGREGAGKRREHVVLIADPELRPGRRRHRGGRPSQSAGNDSSAWPGGAAAAGAANTATETNASNATRTFFTGFPLLLAGGESLTAANPSRQRPCMAPLRAGMKRRYRALAQPRKSLSTLRPYQDLDENKSV